MNILWLSWRDIKNPQSGGAEKVAQEISRRLTRNGHNVTLFTSRFTEEQAKQKFQGVTILRKGNRLTCRFYALIYYLKNKNSFDLIIDEINTIPFFTPIFAKSKNVCLIHQLAREFWFSQTFFPLNYLGYFLEPFWLKLYRKSLTITISASTKKDLESLGFSRVGIMRAGLDIKPSLSNKQSFSSNKKENLILFLGRLTPAKGPQDAIIAFKSISHSFPNLRLSIAGFGKVKFVSYLQKLARNTKVGNKITFCGFVKKSQKIKLLKKAKIILIPSVREGWGLVATEANATGTIPIAYNVPGLKDAIKNGVTGILVPKGPQNLAKAALDILKDDKKLIALSKNGLKHARKFSWDNTYADFTKALGGRFSKASH